jgi:hypothetical protein
MMRASLLQPTTKKRNSRRDEAQDLYPDGLNLNALNIWLGVGIGVWRLMGGKWLSAEQEPQGPIFRNSGTPGLMDGDAFEI